MNNAADGMNYAPKGKPNPVVGPGEFGFSAISLDHGHIYGMCNGLTEAGATLRYVYDPDPEKVAAFVKAFPQVKVAASEQEIFDDPETKLIAGAAVTSERCPLGIRAMEAGKDYCTLVTCTPYGVNTHRLLVRGHRIENIEEAKTVRVTADAIQIEPLLVAPAVALPMLMVLLVVLLIKTRKKKK